MIARKTEDCEYEEVSATVAGRLKVTEFNAIEITHARDFYCTL